ncbi:TIR domain-containing protein [Algoriphagus pacificus]|uniref:TIR domain-containing protein n=1 Tax=Algoriphagus pacificus TaxID=2811234 RepID=A0ABS3CL79_9BACT|nr:TIR domain-containing protein [Algoriphagus pacificus]MBN7816931.1 TIR domain-containing protein [Algoriphagus pacificus]
MARKVFVSYKYSDSLVQDLGIYQDSIFGRIKIATTARHYVDEISQHLTDDDHIYKGENDDESMEELADSSISSKLGDKIFDSSVTIVLISKGMRESFISEKDQWIPWEVSYSLKNQTRLGKSSSTNGVIAVILPDENGSYEYYITYDRDCNCITLNTPILFQIIRDNMFNVKEPNRRICNGSWVYSGDSSYIQSVKWSDFKTNPTKYIDKAIELRDKKDDFKIEKTIK